jgi:hypothetical protein
MIGKVVR